MSDDLTVMGIAATAAAAMGREQIVLAHQAEHPLAGNPDVATDPKPSPDLAVALALPGRCLQVGFDRHQQRLVRDRGLRSPTLCRRLLGVLAGASWRRTRSGPCPMQAVGQTRAGRGGGTHRRNAPKGRRSPSWPPAVPPAWSTLRSASWRYPAAYVTGSPLPLLERGVDPPDADRFLTPLHRAGRSLRPIGATEDAPARHAKASADLTLARHRPSLAKSQRACRQSLAWGKRGRAKLRPHLPQAHQRNFLLKIIGHVQPTLLGHFD